MVGGLVMYWTPGLMTLRTLVAALLVILAARIDAAEIAGVRPTLGKLGDELRVSVKGSSFSNGMRASIAYQAPLTYNGGRVEDFNYLAIPGTWAPIVGEFAFRPVVDEARGFYVTDLSVPREPVVATLAFESPTNPNRHEVQQIEADADRHLAVVSMAGGGRALGGYAVVDIEDPLAPRVLLSKVQRSGYRTSLVHIAGNLAFLAHPWDGGFTVLDLGDRDAPRELTRFSDGRRFIDVQAFGSFAFGFTNADIAELVVFDISNPAAPSPVTTLTTGGTPLDYFRSISLSDDGQTLFVTGYDRLIAIDVSTPTQPVVLGEGINLPALLPSRIRVAGNKAFVVTPIGGVFVVDVSDPRNMVLESLPVPSAPLVGNLDNFHVADRGEPLASRTLNEAYAVALSGQHAYLAFGDGLGIVDVSAPDKPEIVYTANTETHVFAGTTTYYLLWDVAVQNDTAYFPVVGNRLRAFDVSTPASPVELPSFRNNFFTSMEKHPWFGRSFVAADPLCAQLWVTGGDAQTVSVTSRTGPGVAILDTRDPSAIVELARIDTPGNAMDIAVRGGFAYLADTTAFRIYDYDRTVPGAVTTHGAVTLPQDHANVVALGNDVAFVGGFTSSSYAPIYAIDISTPSAPFIIGGGPQVELGDAVQRLQVVGDVLYVANDNVGGIRAYDVSDPSNVTFIGFVDTRSAVGVDVQDGMAYVADGSRGLTITPAPKEAAVTVVDANTLSLTIDSPPAEGHYRLRLFGEGVAEAELDFAVSFEDAQPTSKAIVVAGGGNYPGNHIWEATSKLASTAYQALERQGYSPERIRLLSPTDLGSGVQLGDVNGDGESDVDLELSSDALRSSIVNWAADASDLIVYVAGHGGYETVQLSPNEALSASELGFWLDQLQEDMLGRVIVIYEACQSGTIIPQLRPQPGRQRVVLTSAGDEPAYFPDQGRGAFSHIFWRDFDAGSNLASALRFAQRQLPVKGQTPQVDSNGDGIANGPGDTLKGLGLGRHAPDLSFDRPRIRVTTNDVVVDGNGVLISAEVQVAATPVASVWATIRRPDFMSGPKNVPLTKFEEVVQMTQSDGVWTGSYNQMDVNGTYEISVLAENESGFRSSSALQNRARVTRCVSTAALPFGCLVGNAHMVHPLGEPWLDPGAIAVDPRNGATAAMVAQSQPDPDWEGTYVVLYSGSVSGVAVEAERSVTVSSDRDRDGVPDASDAFPDNPAESSDSDGDGQGDNEDSDDDGDGVLDQLDAFPLDGSETRDHDGDGEGDNADVDDDNDGVADLDDAFPFDSTEQADTDADGLGDRVDPDDDNDGVPDELDAFRMLASESLDTDGDGLGDNQDEDDDNDGTPDVSDAFPTDASESLDTDGDGVGNNADTDDYNDGVIDAEDALPLLASESRDFDGDGIGDNADLDDDNDGVADLVDDFPFDASEQMDLDRDGVGDNQDDDDDGDGVADSLDVFPADPTESLDSDGDGLGNNVDTDDDNDGVPDEHDEAPTDSQVVRFARLGNISTRGMVGNGDEVMIGGVIIEGDEPQKVLIRARGPSLADFGVQGVLLDTTLELYDQGGQLLDTNDDWQSHATVAEIPGVLAPTDPRESAITRTLEPGAYTAILRGKTQATGVGIIEVFAVHGPDWPARR